ncbi:salivary gland secretion 3 [Drosophila yakuba]|nr:salivary gland secretion 3 [Drosophila yakuba]
MKLTIAISLASILLLSVAHVAQGCDCGCPTTSPKPCQTTVPTCAPTTTTTTTTTCAPPTRPPPPPRPTTTTTTTRRPTTTTTTTRLPTTRSTTTRQTTKSTTSKRPTHETTTTSKRPTQETTTTTRRATQATTTPKPTNKPGCGCKSCGPGGIPCGSCPKRQGLCTELNNLLRQLERRVRECVCGQPVWLL